MFDFCFKEPVPFTEVRISRGRAGLGEVNPGKLCRRQLALSIWSSKRSLNCRYRSVSPWHLNDIQKPGERLELPRRKYATRKGTRIRLWGTPTLTGQEEEGIAQRWQEKNSQREENHKNKVLWKLKEQCYECQLVVVEITLFSINGLKQAFFSFPNNQHILKYPRYKLYSIVSIA